MEIEILGSGGALTTPIPACQCQLCRLAREQGGRNARTGPSVFIHDLQLLIDTPEESKLQLNRARIPRVTSCLYSHWHPDHTQGVRVFESLNSDWRNWPRQNRLTDVYLPQQVAADFRVFLGLHISLQYWQEMGVVKLHELQDGERITLGDWQILPLRLAEDYVYAFFLEGQGKRILIAMDELFAWEPPPWLAGLDLAILPKGLNEFHPLTGERHIPRENPVLEREATFEQALAIARQLAARQIVFSHIEETDQMAYEDYLQLEAKLGAEGLPARFAYDGLILEV
jgi:phosphoribosyl 1,2-cyclic phosphate phosphodiesterase